VIVSIYAPLGEYLKNQHRNYIPMTFDEVERLIHRRLPKSKKYPAWWSNNPSNNVMTVQWLEAGYVTEAVDIAAEKLVFRKVHGGSALPNKSTDEGAETMKAKRRHPIFGCMADTLFVAPGVDLTAPADADWGKVYEDE
jgi:hypothetical protein